MRRKKYRDFKPSRPCKIILLVWIIYLLLAPPVPLNAHKVYLFAWAEGDTITQRAISAGRRR